MNGNHPFGFRVVGHATGGCEHRDEEFDIPSGAAFDLWAGDPCRSDGEGGILPLDTDGAGLGIFLGCRYQRPDGSMVYAKNWVSGTTLKAGTTAKALVVTDPFVIMHARTSDTIVAADIGQRVSALMTAGDNLSGSSRAALTAATPNGSFQILRIARTPDRKVDANGNTIGWGDSEPGQYAIAEVKWARHERAGSDIAVTV